MKNSFVKYRIIKCFQILTQKRPAVNGASRYFSRCQTWDQCYWFAIPNADCRDGNARGHFVKCVTSGRPNTSLNFVPFHNKCRNTQQPTTSPMLSNIRRRTIQRLVRWQTGIRQATSGIRQCIWWLPSHPDIISNTENLRSSANEWNVSHWRHQTELALSRAVIKQFRFQCLVRGRCKTAIVWCPYSEPYIKQAYNIFIRIYCHSTTKLTAVFSWHSTHKSMHNSLVFMLWTKLY